MTLTTRTTRKAPWAVALTALLGVLALVFGMMAFAGVASAYAGADKPDDPGKSESAPGHDDTFVPPGQVDDGTPGNSAGKVTICHFVHGKGETKDGYNVITISLNAWEKGHSGGIDDGGNWVHDEKDFVVTPTTPCPPVPPQYCPDGVTPLPANGICPTPPTSEVTYCVATAVDTYAELKFIGTTGTDESGWLNEGIPLSAYTKANPILCATPDEAAAIDAALAEPATVAPVLPGTVEEPETVAVPAPATIPMPATIPAGDGSGTPTVPTALLALLALGATALAASTVHLVRTTR